MKQIISLISALRRLDMVMEKETRVMTCGEAAYILGKTPQTIARYISEGRLHKASANGVVGVRAKEVYEMMTSI